TVNDELSARNSQLMQVNNDLQNLLDSVNIPIIMVGSDLRIRRLTPMTERVLNIIPTDVGRPITDIQLNLDTPGLEKMIADTIDSIQTNEVAVRVRDGHRYQLRIRPYRTADNRIDGAVLIFVDIQSLKDTPEEAQGAHTSAQNFFESIGQPLLFLDGGFRIRKCNVAFLRLFEQSRDEVIGHSF